MQLLTLRVKAFSELNFGVSYWTASVACNSNGTGWVTLPAGNCWTPGKTGFRFCSFYFILVMNFWPEWSNLGRLIADVVVFVPAWQVRAGFEWTVSVGGILTQADVLHLCTGKGTVEGGVGGVLHSVRMFKRNSHVNGGLFFRLYR